VHAAHRLLVVGFKGLPSIPMREITQSSFLKAASIWRGEGSIGRGADLGVVAAGAVGLGSGCRGAGAYL
jgi:hypothetical protein